MDFQNREGSKPGSGGVASFQDQEISRRERQRLLALEVIDLAKDPYFMKNHLGSYECKLCLTLHSNEGSYLSHTQGKKHQENLKRRAARDQQQQQQHGPSTSTGITTTAAGGGGVGLKSFVKIGRPGFKIIKIKDPILNQLGLLIQIHYPQIAEGQKPLVRFMSAYEQRIETPDKNYQYLLVAAEPYETIAIKIQSTEIDKRQEDVIKSPSASSVSLNCLCTHTLTNPKSTVLSLSSSTTTTTKEKEKLLFAGTQNGNIHIWNLKTFELLKSIEGIKKGGAILSMIVYESVDESSSSSLLLLLFAGLEGGLVNCYNISYTSEKGKELSVVFSYSIHLQSNSGNVLSLNLMETPSPDQTELILFIGTKTTNLQWFNLTRKGELCRDKMKQEILKQKQNSRFFFDLQQDESLGESYYCVLQDCVLRNCHYGFIYCLTSGYLSRDYGLCLFSGSGDGTVKIWSFPEREGGGGGGVNIKPMLVKQLDVTASSSSSSGGGGGGSILGLLVKDGLLYCACQGGEIKVYDLEMFQCIRTLMGHTDDVLSLCGGIEQLVFSASADGTIRAWNRHFECVQVMSEHSNESAAVMVLKHCGDYLVSGASDCSIKLWHVSSIRAHRTRTVTATNKQFLKSDGSVDAVEEKQEEEEQDNDYDLVVVEPLLKSLEEFVSVPSVSNSAQHRESCRKAAKYLKNLFTEVGARTEMFAGAEDRNPIVYASFESATTASNLNILFYGHYDVQDAIAKHWKHSPFKMVGEDGYYYGRGVSDNKGPVLAALYAVSELHTTTTSAFESSNKKLECNVKFLVEGEEESGSLGFIECVNKYRNEIGKVDLILLSNSYWITDQSPTLTYGMRGVVHCRLRITSSSLKSDVHSGVFGGGVDEPLKQMVNLLGQIVNSSNNEVIIPGFDSQVRPISQKEKDYISKLATQLNFDADQLISRWARPTLTIHSITGSNPASGVISRECTAVVSMRIVPDQTVEHVFNCFKSYLVECYSKMNTTNELSIEQTHASDWWLADLDDKYYKLAASVVKYEWGTEPWFVREGGSNPVVSFLEKYFQAPVVHIPLGQASDNAHLPNERIRYTNLTKGKNILQNFISRAAELSSTGPEK